MSRGPVLWRSAACEDAALSDVEEGNRTGLRQTRYRALGPIGHGGMATVLRAVDTVLGREVAIKRFAARADDVEQMQLQQREAQLLASFRHHSLVRLYDAGVDFDPDGAPRMFLVMELVEGDDLRMRLRSGALPPLTVAHIGFDLADALAYLHDLGVVHCDMKPANVLLLQWAETRRPRVKLADFGIAQLGEGQPDPMGATTGTAAYLSPEQAAGERIGAASDVYSLGLVLLEALTGRVAFPGGVVESAMARLDRAPDVPDTLPTEWQNLLAGMTARSPERRPSAAEVAIAFRQILADEVAATAAPSPAETVSRIAAVRRYNLLSPGRDSTIDKICELAARLTGADGAVVAVHDDDRVLIKARYGRMPFGSDPYVAGTLESEPTRGTTGGSPLAVAGTLDYCSAPIRTHDGIAIGSVVLFAGTPDRFDDAAAATAQDLADAVVHELELRRAVRRTMLARRTEAA